MYLIPRTTSFVIEHVHIYHYCAFEVSTRVTVVCKLNSFVCKSDEIDCILQQYSISLCKHVHVIDIQCKSRILQTAKQFEKWLELYNKHSLENQAIPTQGSP